MTGFVERATQRDERSGVVRFESGGFAMHFQGFEQAALVPDRGTEEGVGISHLRGQRNHPVAYCFGLGKFTAVDQDGGQIAQEPGIVRADLQRLAVGLFGLPHFGQR